MSKLEVLFKVQVMEDVVSEFGPEWKSITSQTVVGTDPKREAILALANFLKRSYVETEEKIAQLDEDEGGWMGTIEVDERKYTVEVRVPSEDDRMKLALKKLNEVWPHKNPWGPNGPNIVKAVAQKYGLEWDVLCLNFADDWFAREDGQAHPKTVTPELTNALNELCKLWGPENSMSDDDLRTIKRIGRKFRVTWTELYGAFVDDPRAHDTEEVN